MRNLFRNNSYFFLPYVIFLFIGLIVILLTDQSSLHLFFNKYHNSFFNSLFYYITFLGDGFTAAAICVLLLLVKYKYAIITSLSSLLSSAITQLLKHFVFSEALRPKKFFEGTNSLYLIEKVENYSFNSFPSGHTTIAFALLTSLMFFTNNNTVKTTCFFTALLIAYSRVYLSQHFFEDIYAGSVIGCVTSCIISFIFSKTKENSKLNNSLLASIKK